MHAFISRYDRQRQLIWQEVDAFFRNLPAALRTLAWHFSQRMARETSLTGEFSDAFTAPQIARILYLPLWHIDAALKHGADVPDAEAFQQDMGVSVFMGFCALRIQDDVIDGDRPNARMDELLLASQFTNVFIGRLHRRFPAESPFWTYYHRFWDEYTAAVALDRERDQGGIPRIDDATLLQIGHNTALLKIYPVACALWLGKSEDIDRIIGMMDDFNTGIQITNDIQSLKRDLAARHYTVPIARAALAAGYEPGSHPPHDGLYGALALTDAVAKTHAMAIGRIEQARSVSEALEIDDLTGYFTWYLDTLHESGTYWQDLHLPSEENPTPPQKSATQNQVTGPAPSFIPDRTRIAMTFLHADPTFQEAWEIQRSGAWGQQKLIGDLFNQSLILEALAEIETVDTGRVESLLTAYRDRGWRYYTDFPALPPDIDDAAQVFHLIRWTSWSADEKTAFLNPLFRRLAANQVGDGGFPVWLTEEIEDKPQAGWAVLGGSRCLACEANLLAALTDYGTPQALAWVGGAVDGFIDRWTSQKERSFYHYTPAYARFLISRCLQRMQNLPALSAEVSTRLNSLRVQMAQDLIDDPQSCRTAPLNAAAAIMTLTHSPAPPRDLIADLASYITEQQDYDGGWEGCPLFRVPGLTSRINWHRSRLLTTAVALRALSQARV